MPTSKQLYVSHLDAIAKRYAALEDDTMRRSVAMLRDLQKQIAGELGTVTDFRLYNLQRLNANLDALVDGYQNRLTGEVRSGLAGAWQSGGQAVVQPLSALGLSVSLFKPSYAQINAILDFSADMVREISDDVRHGINRQVRLAVLGQKSPFDAMKGITQVLGAQAEYGPFKGRPPVVSGVAARGETVLRTEMMRVFNLASYSQQLATAQQVPGTTKGWMATADSRTRPSHLRAHMYYKDHPIPVDEPFILHDPKLGEVKMMYPLDPRGPASETISCRCKLRTFSPLIGVIGSPLDGRIAAELARRAA